MVQLQQKKGEKKTVEDILAGVVSRRGGGGEGGLLSLCLPLFAHSAGSGKPQQELIYKHYYGPNGDLSLAHTSTYTRLCLFVWHVQTGSYMRFY